MWTELTKWLVWSKFLTCLLCACSAQGVCAWSGLICGSCMNVCSSGWTERSREEGQNAICPWNCLVYCTTVQNKHDSVMELLAAGSWGQSMNGIKRSYTNPWVMAFEWWVRIKTSRNREDNRRNSYAYPLVQVISLSWVLPTFSIRFRFRASQSLKSFPNRERTKGRHQLYKINCKVMWIGEGEEKRKCGALPGQERRERWTERFRFLAQC